MIHIYGEYGWPSQTALCTSVPGNVHQVRFMHSDNGAQFWNKQCLLVSFSNSDSVYFWCACYDIVWLQWCRKLCAASVSVRVRILKSASNRLYFCQSLVVSVFSNPIQCARLNCHVLILYSFLFDHDEALKINFDTSVLNIHSRSYLQSKWNYCRSDLIEKQPPHILSNVELLKVIEVTFLTWPPHYLAMETLTFY